MTGDSAPVYGPNGSHDPALGYVPRDANVGTVESLCRSALMVRAYDSQSGQWSNVLDVAPGC